MKRLVDIEFLNHFNHKYPALKDENLRDLMMYISFGVNKLTEDGCTIISYDILARIAQYPSNDKSFSAKDFLDRYSEIFPEFTYHDYEMASNDWNGRCRRVATSGFDDQDLAVIRAELASTSEMTEKYYFRTGYKYSKRTNAAIRKETLDEFINAKSVFYPKLNETQRKIFDALQPVSLNGEHFIKKMNENHDLIVETIKNLQPSLDDDDGDDGSVPMTIEEKRELQFKILKAIEEDGRVFYRPTRFLRTPRLHANNTCALSLKSEVRKALFKGWWEADFVSSQFVILSAVLGLVEAKKVIGNGKSLWTNLFELIGRTEFSKGEKGVLKTAIYGICFGASKTSTREKLAKANAQAMLDHPLFVELFAKREAMNAKIKKRGCIKDLWGKIHYIQEAKSMMDIYGQKGMAKARWEGSLLATYIQGIEMEIISGAFDVALGPHAKFMAFQHDGFAMWFHSRANVKEIQGRIKAAIATKAAELGKRLNKDFSAMELEFALL